MAMAMGAAGPAGANAKKKTVHASEQKRSDVVQARADWAAGQALLASGRLIFLDETWAITNMMPTWGRSPRGEFTTRFRV